MPIHSSRIEEHLNSLAKLGETQNGGVTRLSLDQNYLKALELLRGWMASAGLEVRLDPAGNLIGRRAGSREDLPAIALGSHIDTVIEGGRYDGTAGVVAGLEVLRALEAGRNSLAHPVELIVFLEEEGTRWGAPLLGSRLMAGQNLEQADLDRVDRDGISYRKAMRSAGLDSARAAAARREPGEFACYLELHIEQGKVLESLGLPVGVVTGIAGPAAMKVAFRGQADHAGATPMHLRRDALVAAAKLILEAKKLAQETSPLSVATVGQLLVRPGAVNVIPGEVVMSVDFRDIDLERRDRLEAALLGAVRAIAGAENLESEVLDTSRVAPVRISDRMVAVLSNACTKNGINFGTLPSGAGHDAQVMSRLTEVGMLFIRSRDGISHAPQEYSTIEDITLGAQALYDAVLVLDERR